MAKEHNLSQECSEPVGTISKPNIDEILRRYRAFWNREKADRVPIILRYPLGLLEAHESYFESQADVRSGAVEKWENLVISPSRYLDYWTKLIGGRAELLDDAVPTAPTDLGPALICGMMGAPMYFGNGTSWTDHSLNDWNLLQRYKYDPTNSWMQYLEEMSEYFLRESKGMFAVGLANFVGPGDVFACLRGPTQVCFDLHDHPECAEELGKLAVDAYLKAINHQLDLLPRYFEGTCDLFYMWTPGRGNGLTCDIAQVLSPELFHTFLLDLYAQIIEDLDACWMHTHSATAFMYDEFLKLNGLLGIQIANDGSAGPSIKQMLPVMKKIQREHCLILRKYSFGEIKSVIRELSPAGLLVDIPCGSLEEAKRILAEWNRLTCRL